MNEVLFFPVVVLLVVVHVCFGALRSVTGTGRVWSVTTDL